MIALKILGIAVLVLIGLGLLAAAAIVFLADQVGKWNRGQE